MFKNDKVVSQQYQHYSIIPGPFCQHVHCCPSNKINLMPRRQDKICCFFLVMVIKKTKQNTF